ncbi:MAG: DNA polymerase I [Acidimicrobiales bacterium]|jgi:DNA polymerase-1|nr:DNA polymerase I [Acidimicrobiales bacterium]MDP6298920.1 DNA polymerase I [Acidimicrobiales bacterium]HJM27879.1 DNA polymerase I [Acidimicrobiales bacterium]HJM98438.1 DNA polymerase I [Acidimicrobiales bacterium]
MKSVMLIDGNSLLYRAFFALSEADMRTSGGQPTGAIYGFLTMLINLIRDHDPDGVAVAFDLPVPTFRHEKIETYKAGRAETPDDLKLQFDVAKEALEVLGIQSIEKAGFEADDILATFAAKAINKEISAIVVTGDRDSYQLVRDPFVKVLYNRRGVSDYVLYDEDGIRERTGVTPSDYVTYAALRGDKSDNLPGVPGVGEKTAAKLVNQYRTLDGIFGAANEQTPKLRSNLEENEQQARLNVEIMTLVTDVPTGVDLEDLTPNKPEINEVKKLFEKLELRTLYQRLGEVFEGEFASEDEKVQSLKTKCNLLSNTSELIDHLQIFDKETGPIGLAGSWATEESLSGLAVGINQNEGAAIWFPITFLKDKEVKDIFSTFLQREGGIVGHGLKRLIRGLLWEGYPPLKIHLDTQIAAYLLNPAEADYPLPDLTMQYAGRNFTIDEVAEEGQLNLDGDPEAVEMESAQEALCASVLANPLKVAIKEQGLENLNEEIEIPLIGVLAEMEYLGIQIDVKRLTELRDELQNEVGKIREIIHELAGEEFNVNSTKQLQVVLFENLGLTPRKKTKTGYSTDAQTLEKMKDDHPVVNQLLQYREVEKLRSTYGEGLLAVVGSGDRIRATFRQTVARTGRLSSDAPNLHNIPVRTEKGKVFREVFIAKEDWRLLVADYNQIELRCIAHLSEDPGLIRAFKAGEDIHTATAAQVFGVVPEEVSKAQRERAKMVSYGLVYGMEAYGLAQRLGIANKEAANILDSYFGAFPSVKDYMESTVQVAKERGYTETLFGRRRRIPELMSSNSRIRAAGERQAMNAGIQGLAADIFKVALVNLHYRLKKENMGSRIVLQVHDEVILECPKEEVYDAEKATIEVMGSAFDMSVPLAVNISSGATWAEAK